MKVVILAAGHKAVAPKCLYSHRGEILLARQVRILRELGLNDIRIVVGCEAVKVVKFIKDRNLDLEIIYNTVQNMWEKGGFLYSLKLGVTGVVDDVLILVGDVYINKEGFQKALDIFSSVTGESVVGMHRLNIHFCFIRKDLIVLVQNLPARFPKGWNRRQCSLFRVLSKIILDNGGIGIQTGMYDLDNAPKKICYDSEGFVIYPSIMRR